MCTGPTEDPRFELRFWTLDDSEQLFDLYVTHEDLRRQLPSLGSRSDAEATLSGYLPTNDDRAVFCLDFDGRASGLIGLSFQEKTPATGTCDRAWVWYWSAGKLRGRGVMKLAVKLVCDWAQNRIDKHQITKAYRLLTELPSPCIRRLELGYRLNNPGSAKIAEAAGFVVEGVEREKFMIDGKPVDAALAARL